MGMAQKLKRCKFRNFKEDPKVVGILGGCKKFVNLGILKRIQKLLRIAEKLKRCKFVNF